MTIYPGLRAPLATFVAIAGAISICQADYINADFVAYSTVAHRVIESPVSSLTGSWSPLYSWLMVPMLALGIPDLIAGRIVLLISGVLYLGAADRLARKFFPPDLLINRLLIRGLMTCATLQAIWFSTYLLNPDLLACAIVFWYFVVVLDRNMVADRQRSFVAGIFAGLAYLAKAYMLPFCVTQFIVVIASNRLLRRKSDVVPQPTPSLSALLCMVVGLGIVAGPWIVVLTQKYDRLTFTNAGRANHANVGPDSFGKDLLWHPPLTRDYILEPVIATEWSPFSSIENLRHQVHVILHNTANCIGLIPGWLALVVVVLFCCAPRQQSIDLPGYQLVWWAILTAAVYCSGYVTVNLETRYIVPIVAPLFCFAAGGLIQAGMQANQGDQSTRGLHWLQRALKCGMSERRLSIATILVVLGFAGVDVYSIANVAIIHPQSASISKFKEIARRLEAAGLTDQISASDRYHEGLYLAYVCGNVSKYLGSPQATELPLLNEELIANGVRVNFHWNADVTEDFPESTVTAARSRPRPVTIVDKSLGAQAIEVYIR